MSVATKEIQAPLSLEGLSPEARVEIERFRQEIESLERGELDQDSFKRFRLENGVYGIRGNPDLHMIRVKVKYGRISSDQLEAMADLADCYTPNRKAHLTTRQDLQFHFVRRSEVPTVLAWIAQCGLTTREACGNTVRNVTACPFAGVSATEAFDVTPYADAVSEYFLRNPLNQNLPRKFKFAFEGCPEDHARTAIHDLGAVAAIREVNGKSERGFRIYIAGGLGAQPRSAELLEEFTPADMLIPTCEATIRVFDRHGERRPERTHRMRARMKFIAKEWGIDKLKKAILNERKFVIGTRSGAVDYHIAPLDEEAPRILIPDHAPRRWSATDHYKKWLQTNVTSQKQHGYSVVLVRCDLGDVSSANLRAVAATARRWCGGRTRITITQNLALRWVPNEALPWVYTELAEAGLSEFDAHSLADITRCPGADTCQLALTHSRGLSEAIGEVLSTRFQNVPEVHDLSIKISGCMNSCGQHHIADIGFYGVASELEGRPIPQYVMLIGGRTREGLAQFGKPVARIPARLAPEALARLLDIYRYDRHSDEPFQSFIARVGASAIRERLSYIGEIPAGEIDPMLFRDLGAAAEVFTGEVGAGECAS